MWNIMKAQNYQTRNDNLTVYLFGIGLLLPFAGMLLESELDFGAMTGSMAMAHIGDMLFVSIAVVALLLTTRICGWDQADKTMNYEVLSGHDRSEVFFGRVLVSLMWGEIGSMAVAVFPVLVCSVINGWGMNMKFSDIVLRYVLLLFPVFRLVCEFALLTFLLQNCYKAMLVGWVLFDFTIIGGLIYEEMTNKTLTLQFAGFNISYLIAGFNSKLEYINGEDVPIYVTAVGPSMAGGTIFISLLVGGGCLLIGYLFFRRQDIH